MASRTFSIASDGAVLDDDADWCPRCEVVRVFHGEYCATCGYEWGSSEYGGGSDAT